MPGNKQDIKQKLQLLRQQYADKLPERVIDIEQKWLALNQSNPETAEYQNLIREFHSLAGSGASYGFANVTTLSREIENILLDSITNKNQHSEEILTQINIKLSALKQAAAQPPD
jgi:chemotaxis protein histidine kinase CheA